MRFELAMLSPRRIIKAIEVPDERTDPSEKHQWSNLDLDPTARKERIWGKWTFLAFWTAHAAGAGSWTAGSSVIALGLSPIVAWLTLATSHILITMMIVLNGRASSRYHVGYPVFSRAVYGMWGSYLAVAMRAVVCIIWNGTNACMSFIHARDLKWFYHVKSVLVFAAMHGILIWWMMKSGGEAISSFSSKPMSHDSWLWLSAQAFNAGLGAASSLTVNQGDMTRYATKPKDAIWTTLIGYPIASALPCLYGILVASAAKKITGKAVWNLWDTLDYMLLQYDDNRGARFGIFLASGALALAYIGVNLATNCLPFGSDLTALFPKYFTIRRGQVLCTVLGVAIVPWKILASAQAFITFLSGYGYWLAPIAGCLFAEYYVISRGNLDLSQLYTSNPNGRYWYAKGWNWRAIAATFLALLPCLPGFATQLTTKDLGINLLGRRMFYISFSLTYVLSITLYLSFTYAFPRKYVKEHNLRSERWEQLADELDAKEAEESGLLGVEEGNTEDDVKGEGDSTKDEIVSGVAYVEPARAELR